MDDLDFEKAIDNFVKAFHIQEVVTPPTFKDRLESIAADVVYKPSLYLFKIVRFISWQVKEAWKDSEL